MQFTAGEPTYGYKRANWNNFRCGSIFTAKIDSTSFFGAINKFVQVRQSSMVVVVVVWVMVTVWVVM